MAPFGSCGGASESMSMAPPADVKCGICGRYLCSVDGQYVRSAPCQCGWQTTVEAVGRRARQSVETPAGRLEVKSAR